MSTTASGVLRYGPTAETVDRAPWWMILHCGPDWFHLYSQWMTEHSEGRWAHVVDPARIFRGQDVDREPRLALLRPVYEPPAWGPHISIMRGEKPLKNLDLWVLQRKIGDAQWGEGRAATRLKRMVETLAELKAQCESASKKQIHSLKGQIRGLETKISKQRRWRQGNKSILQRLLGELQDRRGRMPSGLDSGMEIEFTYEPSPRTKSFLHHWWLDVRSEELENIREFYGLPREPKVPFHLTLGIESGKG